MSTLEPDMLLYKAATAHNLPVMCHAIAMGANKNWKNPNDKGRTCLFQAIHSVIYKHNLMNIQNSKNIL